MSGWIDSATADWIWVDGDRYYETRPDPDDPENKVEYRARAVSIYETRGHTFSTGQTIYESTQQYGSNGSVVCRIRRLPADGADVIKIVDIALSDWGKGTTTIS